MIAVAVIKEGTAVFPELTGVDFPLMLRELENLVAAVLDGSRLVHADMAA